ncbi:MAG: ABC transporter substrate-binding protein [Gammaproteobacteria bacterium]|nr:ABC transporter substrate-binding protein [Gammaproteobacteria bacterium]
MIKRLAMHMAAVFCLSAITMTSHAEVTQSHGISVFGDLKYGADFKHFDYANPDAPNGGTVHLSALGGFDNLNQFILKGVSASGASSIYDSLTTGSADEPFSQYGLVAETIEVPDDKSWVIFDMRKQARWHDGKPLTADDVAWTFDALKTKGHPFYRAYYSRVEKAEILEPYKIKFHFSETGNAELPMIIGQMEILPKHYYEKHDFAKTTLEPPLGSGPYRIKDVDAGRSIAYELVGNYWAKDLPVRKGSNNFAVIQYDYYRDLTVALEALKAGDVDFREEYISRNWKTAYDFPALRQGRVVKEDLPDGSTQPMQAFMFNLRKPKYADRRVRQAIGLAFDFEWLNKNLFFDTYKRNTSFFQNSELASRGLPTDGELTLLNEFRDQLADEIFTTEFKLPVTDGRGNPRANYRKALGLLKQAGWVIRDGKLTNATSGEVFKMEFVTRQPSMEKLALTFKKSLERLGITLKVRVIDNAQYQQLVESFEFDTITMVLAQSLSPGNEQYGFWSSAAADEQGSRNYAGIQNPVIDKIIDRIVKAKSRQQQIDSTRALDRILLYNHYVIPQYFGDTYRVAYWNRFSRPDIRPKHALGFNYWWVDPVKEAALKN